MLYKLLARRRVFWVYTRDLEQHSWYASVLNSKYVHAKSFSSVWLIAVWLLTQGVGPNIAISFSVYETLRSFWKLHR